MTRRKQYNPEEDKLKILYPNYKDVLKDFHIDFEEGLVYRKHLWEKEIIRPMGRPATSGDYTRININCPHLKHIWARGYVDVFAHRLIKYAYDGTLAEVIDHRYKTMKKMQEELGDLVKNAKTLDTIHNIRATTPLGNRINQQKTSRKKNETISNKQKVLEGYIGITYKYDFYWAYHKKEILNDKGFIHPYLAVDFRNKFMIEKYGEIAQESLGKVNQKDLELFKTAQEAIEKTEDYKTKHIEIDIERSKRKLENLQNKIKQNKFTDYFEDLG